MTASAKYTYIIGDNAADAAQRAYAARYTQDDATINNGAVCKRARLGKETVWLVRYLPTQKPSVYITFQQAAALGVCAWHMCGKVATVVGFEGYRCNAHAKGGMSTVCATAGCTRPSHTGFSTWCAKCITPEQRAAHEAYQAEQRAMWANTPYGSAPVARIGWQRVVGAR